MNLLPPRGIARTLCVQSVVYAVGNGVFATGSAVFFLRVAGLTPVQVGIGFSLAGALSLLLSVPLGAVADRFGGRRTWLAGVLCEAGVFLPFPLSHRFGAVLVSRMPAPALSRSPDPAPASPVAAAPAASRPATPTAARASSGPPTLATAPGPAASPVPASAAPASAAPSAAPSGAPPPAAT